MSDITSAIIAALSREISLQQTFPTTATRLFFRKGERITLFVELYENWVCIEGFVSRSSLVLSPKRLLEFFRELEKIYDQRLLGAHVRVHKVEEGAIFLFPWVEYGIVVDRDKDPSVIVGSVVRHFQGTVSKLAKIEELVKKFETYNIGSEMLGKIWSEAKLEKNKNRKGELFERFISSLITLDENLMIEEINTRTESEEIDIVIKNYGHIPFYAQIQSPIILIECKNWTSNISAKEVRDFVQKVENRPRVLCKVGVLITTSTLTEDAVKELIRHSGKNFTIAIMDGDDIETLIKSRIPFSKLLENKIISSGLR